MTTFEADEILEKIKELFKQIEFDKELKDIDSRYSIIASLANTDINIVDIE